MDDNIALVLIILILAIAFVSGLSIFIAYGATEEQCTRYSSSEIRIIASGYGEDFGGCDWLVDKFLWNNSGFQVDQYDFSPSNGYSYRYEAWVLTK